MEVIVNMKASVLIFIGDDKMIVVIMIVMVVMIIGTLRFTKQQLL